jgi:tetratricopeptide (TPR) repeat protein
MLTKNPSIALVVAILAIAFGGVFFLSDSLSNSRPVMAESVADEDLALQAAKMKGYMIGFEGLAADWYWMQSLQYIGNKVLKTGLNNLNIEDLTTLNPRLLHPYLESAVILDPKFTAVYSYGAIVLPAVDKQKAIEIVELGIRENPNEWRLYQHLGYIHWRLKNFEKASEVYETGSKIAGSPAFMKMMAAQMKTKGGSPETAREMYEQMLAEADDSKTKEIAELRLLELDSFAEREAIQDALDSFKSRNGRCPGAFAEIFPLLKTVKLPKGKDFRIDRSNNIVDPTDAPYLLNSQTCQVTLDSKNTKIPLQ